MEEQQSTQQPQAVINNQPPVQAKPPKKKSGAGKTILIILLGLILLAGAGFAGYTYANNQNKKTEELNKANIEAYVDELKKQIEDLNASNDSNDTSAEGSKLLIGEWGVELMPTESAMSYIITSPGGGVEIAYLTNAKVQGFEGCKATKESPELGYLAALSRYKTKPATAEPNSTYVTQIGEYYYYVAGSQALCSTDKADQQLETDQRAALVESAKSVQASE